jgi:thiosulfate:glutathione sulfurtransferase
MMLRTTITRSARAAARPIITASVLRASTGYNQLRFQTNIPPKAFKTPEQLARKAALEKQDNLQRDWDGKEITYSELKPRTECPTPVSTQ